MVEISIFTIFFLRLFLSFRFEVEDISNTRNSVSSDFQTLRISSKKKRVVFSTLFSVFGNRMKHCRSCSDILLQWVANERVALLPILYIYSKCVETRRAFCVSHNTYHNVQGSICWPTSYDLLQSSFAHVPEYCSVSTDVTGKLNSPIPINIISSGVCPESCVWKNTSL